MIDTVLATLIEATGILDAFALALVLRSPETFLVFIGRPPEECND